ncbi:MAG: alkaline phosphatase [Pirellulaceae bacterium]
MTRLLCNAVSALLVMTCTLPLSAEIPKNVILMIGDGMGFEHVKAANYYRGGQLSFELFPHQGQVTTHSANSAATADDATDSAATAMATGQNVNNGVISVAASGDGGELRTLVEIFSSRYPSTGLVTTTPMTHATPAAFAAHELSRTSAAAIADDYFRQTRPNVLFGGGGPGMSASAAQAAGYKVVSTLDEMQSADTRASNLVSGQFGANRMPYEWDETFGELPRLSQMTSVALDILDNDTDGFFLMVEGGLIDWAAHERNIERTVCEVREFGHSVDVVLSWAADREDTLILATADHETGGLMVTDNGQNAFPTATWSGTGHTAANVPIYAWGANAHLIDAYLVDGVMDNTAAWPVCPNRQRG